MTFKWLKANNSENDRFDNNDSKKIARKLGKLKSEKLFKFQKLAKSRKRLSKNRNLSHFSTKKTRPSFLTFGIKKTFNYL